MELCHREAKPGWWCIKDECKYHKGNTLFKEQDLCGHHSIVEQAGYNYPVKDLLMCPVLTSITLDVLMGD
jgi:hypothetical protein